MYRMSGHMARRLGERWHSQSLACTLAIAELIESKGLGLLVVVVEWVVCECQSVL